MAGHLAVCVCSGRLHLDGVWTWESKTVLQRLAAMDTGVDKEETLSRTQHNLRTRFLLLPGS